jgi:hypothetical protein
MRLPRRDDRTELKLPEVVKLHRVLQPDVLVQAAITAVLLSTALHRTAVPSTYGLGLPPPPLLYFTAANFNLPFLLFVGLYLSKTAPVLGHFFQLRLYTFNLTENTVNIFHSESLHAWHGLRAKVLNFVVYRVNTFTRLDRVFY